MTVAGLALLIAGAVLLLTLWARQGAAEADPVASTVGGLVAVAGATAALLTWRIARWRTDTRPATAEQVDHAAATLAGAVRQQWTREAQVRALGDPEPMPVRWRLAPAALMDHAELISPGRTPEFSGSSNRIDRLTSAFYALPRRRLVITGGPGAGKTTLAMQLLLDMLPKVGQPLTGPVPVLLSLASWDPELQPSVQEFIAAQLDFTYPAVRASHSNAATTLVAQGRVLPILDGLDEIVPSRRARIISTLNATLDPGGGVILTSRSYEYRQTLDLAESRLTAAAVISPLALTRTEVADYLRNHLPPGTRTPWDDVIQSVESGVARNVAALTATPLGLWLIRAAYIDGHLNPEPLIDTTFSSPQVLRRHLLDQLIPAVVRAQAVLPKLQTRVLDASLQSARRHSPDELQMWLSIVANQIGNTGSPDWAWWLHARYTFRKRRAELTMRALAALLGGLVAALFTGLATGLTTRPSIGLTTGLVSFLVLGPATGMAIRLTAEPRRANTRIVGRARHLASSLATGVVSGLAVGVGLGLAFGLASGIAIGLAGGLAFGLAFGLALAPTTGLAIGIMSFLETIDGAESAKSPWHSYQADRKVAMISSLAVGIAVGIAVGLASGLASAVTVGPAARITIGLAAGVASTLPTLARSAWCAFIAAALANTGGRLPRPWRAMSTLQDCYQLGLLRTVGSVYQFRHAELQIHLADATSP